MNLLAISIGATLGAWLRWGLSLLLNSVHAQIAFGTCRLPTSTCQ